MNDAHPKGRKSWPSLTTDEEAERFVAEADLTDYDWSVAELVRFEFVGDNDHVDLKMPKAKIDAVDDAARKRGVSRDDFIRQAIDKALLEPAE